MQFDFGDLRVRRITITDSIGTRPGTGIPAGYSGEADRMVCVGLATLFRGDPAWCCQRSRNLPRSARWTTSGLESPCEAAVPPIAAIPGVRSSCRTTVSRSRTRASAAHDLRAGCGMAIADAGSSLRGTLHPGRCAIPGARSTAPAVPCRSRMLVSAIPKNPRVGPRKLLGLESFREIERWSRSRSWDRGDGSSARFFPDRSDVRRPSSTIEVGSVRIPGTDFGFRDRDRDRIQHLSL